MSIKLNIVELENVRSEVQVLVDDNRPIKWTAYLVKGKEFKANINGEQKDVYTINLVQRPLIYLLADRFTDVENVEDEKADQEALSKVFSKADFQQLMNFVVFTESISNMMQNSSLVVDHPQYELTDDGVQKIK